MNNIDQLMENVSRLTPEKQKWILRFARLMEDGKFAAEYDRRLKPGQTGLPHQEAEDLMVEWERRKAAVV